MSTVLKLILLLTGLSTTIVNAYAAGGISLSSTRIIYPNHASQTSLSIANSSTTERYLVNSWIENINGEKDKRFVVTPPLFVSESKSENTLRIMYVGEPLSEDRESVFWLNVKAIPSVDKNQVANKNVLQLAILSRIKIFVRPQKLSISPDEARSYITFSHSGNALKINNLTPYYISMVNLKIGGQKLPNTMIAPKSATQVTLSNKSRGTVSFQTVNDYGALTPEQTGTMK